MSIKDRITDLIEDGLWDDQDLEEQFIYQQGEASMAEYTAVVDFALWPNEERQGNQPHYRSGKVEMSTALLLEMVNAKKRGENVILQVAAWNNTSREDPSKKYLGCKLSCNGWLMNNEAKKKEDSGVEGTYSDSPEEEKDENGGDEGLFD